MGIGVDCLQNTRTGPTVTVMDHDKAAASHLAGPVDNIGGRVIEGVVPVNEYEIQAFVFEVREGVEAVLSDDLDVAPLKVLDCLFVYCVLFLFRVLVVVRLPRVDAIHLDIWVVVADKLGVVAPSYPDLRADAISQLSKEQR